MAKFKAGDIVVVNKSGQWQTTPVVVLGEHTFSNGFLDYRYRSCVHQYDLVDDAEHWDKTDGYIEQSFLDDFKLIWRSFF